MARAGLALPDLLEVKPPKQASSIDYIPISHAVALKRLFALFDIAVGIGAPLAAATECGPAPWRNAVFMDDSASSI